MEIIPQCMVVVRTLLANTLKLGLVTALANRVIGGKSQHAYGYQSHHM